MDNEEIAILTEEMEGILLTLGVLIPRNNFALVRGLPFSLNVGTP